MKNIQTSSHHGRRAPGAGGPVPTGLPRQPPAPLTNWFPLHLDLPFAPMLLFSAPPPACGRRGAWRSQLLAKLSTLHTGVVWKSGGEWGAPRSAVGGAHGGGKLRRLSIILGVLMAFRFGRIRKAASGCLALGVIIPLVLVLRHIFR